MSYHDIDPAELEPIDNPAALDWAAKWSNATEAAYPRDELHERIRSVLDTDDRIPYVTRRGEWLYNFWRDAEHPRGLWRRTTLDSYRGEPDWDVLVDVDKLAATEKEDWVWKGAHVRAPEYDLALVRLSRGGADATVVREFDLRTGAFVDGGFELPEAKTDVSWVDPDTLLVGTDTGAGSLTTSGYPREVRLWRRGQDIIDAPIYATGSVDDVLVGAWYEPTSQRTIVARALDFYNQITSVDKQVVEVPTDCDTVVHDNWLILKPRTEFAGIPAGGLGIISLDDFLAGSRSVQVIFTPTKHTSLQSLAMTHNYLVLTLLDNVATVIRLVPFDGSADVDLDLPQAVTATVVSTNHYHGDEIWISASSFTVPPTLYRWDSGEMEKIKQAPAQFDATGIETRQHWTTSADGTQIPYFITGMFNTPRPTLVTAYGGFEVSLTPGYSSVRGIAWLEHGYHFVQANLRGGGEFGPEWHSQVVKTNRIKVWEDHRAVIEDLRERGYVTTLGIRGGSNGGLLTSGALNMYPELLDASVIQVPLTDMLRYHQWSAGASWMAEYGNPEDDGERAAIKTWSPLHNVHPHNQVAYPAALVTTSTRDDRVHPAHARLFARALSEAGQPVDYFENTAGGHAGAADNDQVARVESLIYSWLRDKLDRP